MTIAHWRAPEIDQTTAFGSNWHAAPSAALEQLPRHSLRQKCLPPLIRLGSGRHGWPGAGWGVAVAGFEQLIVQASGEHRIPFNDRRQQVLGDIRAILFDSLVGGVEECLGGGAYIANGI